MPIATPEKYAEMLDAAKTGGFAFPAINVSSSQTLNAALQGFADLVRRDGGLVDILPELGVLAVFAAVTLSLATRLLHRATVVR